MAAEAENLDVRMEAIRLKNEELEKKHKEIMEDELLAKQKNATVDVKSSSGPAIHPYDDLELDFDVKDKEKDLGKNPDFKPKSESSRSRIVLFAFAGKKLFLMFSSSFDYFQIEGHCHAKIC